jgi:integrase
VAAEGVPPEWLAWCQRWQDHSGLALKTRRGHYDNLLVIGRWLAQRHPELVNLADWTREAAATFVAAVDQRVGGEWSHPLAHAQGSGRLGQPLAPATKAGYLATLSRFFRDGQDWDWRRRRFDPRRAFATSPRIRALLGTQPRVIVQDVWAKLLWAGPNFTEDDLTAPSAHRFAFAAYPLTMVRAVAISWLFTGLRADELRRLPVGCVRWLQTDVTVPGTTEVLPRDAVCFLDVPVNKTAPAFTKPVDRPVGEAIAAWESVRPAQPPCATARRASPSIRSSPFAASRSG